MKKTFCDRCGMFVEDYNITKLFVKKDGVTEHTELCPACSKAIQGWLKGEEMETEKENLMPDDEARNIDIAKLIEHIRHEGNAITHYTLTCEENDEIFGITDASRQELTILGLYNTANLIFGWLLLLIDKLMKADRTAEETITEIELIHATLTDMLNIMERNHMDGDETEEEPVFPSDEDGR